MRDKKHGFGRFFGTDGSIFEGTGAFTPSLTPTDGPAGEFVKNRKHGKGKLHDPQTGYHVTHINHVLSNVSRIHEPHMSITHIHRQMNIRCLTPPTHPFPANRSVSP